MYGNEFEAKKKEKLTEIKNYLQHNIHFLHACNFVRLLRVLRSLNSATKILLELSTRTLVGINTSKQHFPSIHREIFSVWLSVLKKKTL